MSVEFGEADGRLWVRLGVARKLYADSASIGTHFHGLDPC